MASRIAGFALTAQSVVAAPELVAAYRVCRGISKREAKNFYYGFLALPRAKSDAMCAMYAFMRRADDIADDESLPIVERRALMTRWLAAFHANAPFETADGAVFLAVRDVQRRFNIADGLLDELVEGTAMDLRAEAPEGVERFEVDGRCFDAYRSLAALERYCYLVASVVGLVTIRIFGFRDENANRYAIDLGKAFQFTNILRDVQEDAERGRIYLPVDVLRTHGSSAEWVVDASRRHAAPTEVRAAMRDLGRRAESLYGAGDALIPLLHPDSRAAMRVLISIYHSLLIKLERENFQVFGHRVHVSKAKKLSILFRGILRGALQRSGL